MAWMPGPVEAVRRAGFLARRALARDEPGPSIADSRERVLVAVGEPGAFGGIEAEARVAIGARGRLLAAAMSGHPRLHVVPGPVHDVLVFAPTNLGDFNAAHVFPYLDDVFDRLGGRAAHAAVVEYGTSPEIPARLSLVRAAGEPVPGAPSVAMSLAAWREGVGVGIRTGLVDGAGPIQNGYLASTVLFALRADPDEARRALDRVARGFSARQMRLRRMPGAVPEDCLVLDLSLGLARNDLGDEVGLAQSGPAPALA